MNRREKSKILINDQNFSERLEIFTGLMCVTLESPTRRSVCVCVENKKKKFLF